MRQVAKDYLGWSVELPGLHYLNEQITALEGSL